MTPVFIMAVPWIPQRAVRAKQLAEETGGEVVWDEQYSGYLTYRMVLERMGEDQAILLEDDVVLCTGWRELIEVEAAAHPEHLVQCYVANELDTEGWHPGKMFGGNCNLVFPAGMAQKLLAWLDTRKQTKQMMDYYDLTTGSFLHSQKLDYWQVNPGLVQHKPWVSAVNQNRSKRRVSKAFRDDVMGER